MGYLFLAIALLSGSAKGFCGKKISSRVAGFKDVMLANFIRMFFCVIIGFTLVGVMSGIGAFRTSPSMIVISALSGITTAGFVIFWLICVKNGAYVMLDVFLMLGVIVATVLCRIFLGEIIQLNQYIGFIILIAAAYIMCSYNISLKGNFTFKSFLLLVLCGVSNGLTSFSQKLFVYYVPGGNSVVFNFYTYIFAALVLFVSYFICQRKSDTPLSEDFKLVKGVCTMILIMSVCLFANSYFMVLAAKTIPSAILFSVTQGSSIILAAIMAALFFGEKPSVKSIVGMITAFAGLVVINLF